LTKSYGIYLQGGSIKCQLTFWQTGRVFYSPLDGVAEEAGEITNEILDPAYTMIADRKLQRNCLYHFRNKEFTRLASDRSSAIQLISFVHRNESEDAGQKGSIEVTAKFKRREKGMAKLKEIFFRNKGGVIVP
jgi:hypothetical protein